MMIDYVFSTSRKKYNNKLLLSRICKLWKNILFSGEFTNDVKSYLPDKTIKHYMKVFNIKNCTMRRYDTPIIFLTYDDIPIMGEQITNFN